MVHYVLPDGDSAGEHRPAVVVKVCPKEWSYPDGAVQLQVFTDSRNDGPEYASGIVWRTSVHFDAEGKPGTWHWIERA